MSVAGHYDDQAGVRRERSPLNLFHNDAKRALLARFAPRGGRLLDLACGRGGDVHKWTRLGVAVVKGLDCSARSVEEARARFQAARGGGATRCEFEQVDLARAAWTDGAQYDVVTCMFALHYFFETEAAAKALFRTASQSLRPGGVFVGIVPDGLRVNAACMRRTGPAFDNGVVRLEARWQGKPRPFGSAYTCSIRKTVTEDSDDVLEYLVYANVVEALAAHYGLLAVPLDLPEFEPAARGSAFHALRPPYAGPMADCSALFAAFAFRKA